MNSKQEQRSVAIVNSVLEKKSEDGLELYKDKKATVKVAFTTKKKARIQSEIKKLDKLDNTTKKVFTTTITETNRLIIAYY